MWPHQPLEEEPPQTLAGGAQPCPRLDLRPLSQNVGERIPAVLSSLVCAVWPLRDIRKLGETPPNQVGSLVDG